jgi:hypothetical protein
VAASFAERECLARAAAHFGDPDRAIAKEEALTIVSAGGSSVG